MDAAPELVGWQTRDDPNAWSKLPAAGRFVARPHDRPRLREPLHSTPMDSPTLPSLRLLPGLWGGRRSSGSRLSAADVGCACRLLVHLSRAGSSEALASLERENGKIYVLGMYIYSHEKERKRKRKRKKASPSQTTPRFLEPRHRGNSHLSTGRGPSHDRPSREDHPPSKNRRQPALH